MDLERLDSAIRAVNRWQQINGASIPLEIREYLMTVMERASAYRDLLANGERVEWCEEHHMSTNPGSARCLRWMELVDAELAGIRECRIVSKLLVDPPTEED